MSDSRAFTDWTPDCANVYKQFVDNKFKSSYDQRQYFINNAEKMMEHDRSRLVSCSCYLPTEKGTMVDEKNMQKCNKNYCEFKTSNPEGIGMGSSYFEPKPYFELR
jgi:hypothetical protein